MNSIKSQIVILFISNTKTTTLRYVHYLADISLIRLKILIILGSRWSLPLWSHFKKKIVYTNLNKSKHLLIRGISQQTTVLNIGKSVLTGILKSCKICAHEIVYISMYMQWFKIKAISAKIDQLL